MAPQRTAKYFATVADAAKEGFFVTGPVQLQLHGGQRSALENLNSVESEINHLDTLRAYSGNPGTLQQDFRTVLTVFLDGKDTRTRLPVALRGIFYTETSLAMGNVLVRRCNFYYLKCYLQVVNLMDNTINRHKREMYRLCQAMFLADLETGMYFQSLVTLVFYIRCFMGMGDGYLMPLEVSDNVAFNPHRTDRQNKCLEECTTYEEVELGMETTDGPGTSIILPRNGKFSPGDLLAEFSAGDNTARVKCCYQMKAGKAGTNKPPMPGFFNFLVKGDAPQFTGEQASISSGNDDTLTTDFTAPPQEKWTTVAKPYMRIFLGTAAHMMPDQLHDEDSKRAATGKGESTDENAASAPKKRPRAGKL